MTATSNQLVKRDALIALLFAPDDRPSVRTFESWKAKRLIPFVKLVGRCWYSPEAVRAALARNTVAAR
jgi:hypothetical protein